MLPTLATSALALTTLFAHLSSATSLHLTLSPSSSLLDPRSLPASTHATLYGSNGKRVSAPLRRDNSFVFGDVGAGEWLLDVFAREYVFPSLRVDVHSPASASAAEPTGQEGQEGGATAVAEVYVAHPSNKWSNKGALLHVSTSQTINVAVSAQAKRQFYQQREGFDLLGFFKNPMILMGVVSMGLVFGMPYLMENSEWFLSFKPPPPPSFLPFLFTPFLLSLPPFPSFSVVLISIFAVDEETKAEFQEIQKSGGLTGAGGAGGAAQQIQNFDLAGWMAGKSDSAPASARG